MIKCDKGQVGSCRETTVPTKTPNHRPNERAMFVFILSLWENLSVFVQSALWETA